MSNSWESQLSPKEASYFVQLFKRIGKSQEGIVNGGEAVRFFATSGVPNEILSEIWEAADRDKVGYLTLETFSVALKLIACAQHGKEATEPVLATVVPLPQFDGVVAPSPIVSNNTPLLSTPSINNVASSPITQLEREKYANIFKVHQPVNGVLDANTARSVFLKSKLPMDMLSQIWYLADVRQSGSLNQTEFIIAMHYIAKLMDGTLSSLPDKLPPTVFQSAEGNTTLHATMSPSFRSNTIMTPPQRARTIDSLGNLAFGPSAPIHEPIQHWDVSAQEKQQFDAYFDKIDSKRAGLIQGKEAVEFFKNSRLPENELAHVWDLSDIQQRGALSRDEFAVAMYLIHKRLAGENLPQSLPKTLVPPGHNAPPLQSPFTNVVSSPSISNASPAITQQRSLVDHDLLGDFSNDSVSQETNQVNLIQNQISSMSLQTTDLSNQKASAENVLEQLSQQRKDLEAQMTKVRMAHEAAVKDLNEIQETVRREEGEWDQVRAEYEQSQQQLTQIQNELAQTQQTLENGRAETESLRRRVHEIQEETGKANEELEKLRAQSKQTTMMLDINRRQVTAAEQDRSLAKRNLEDYKVAANLNTDQDSEESEEESIFVDKNVQKNEPVTTPALQNLFGSESPSVANTTSPFVEFNTPPTEHNNLFSTTAEPTAISGNDFDAIFGSPSIESISTPVQAFDPSQWMNTTPTTPTGNKSRAPPPPPPQSKHHRQPSEVSSVTSSPSVISTSKKQRAPPPPPPAATFTSTPQIEEEDDFEAAFSGKLPEAKIVTKANEDEFADFDDAFSSFDTSAVKVASPVPAPTVATSDNWATSFGGFNFPSDDHLNKPAAPATTTATKDEDWDSIFGTSTQQPATATVKEPVSTGFDDAFSSFGDDFGKQPIISNKPSPTPSSIVEQQPKKSAIGSIGIVGDKIGDLVKIGFNEQEAKDALNRYDQDLEKATNFLLDQSSKA